MSYYTLKNDNKLKAISLLLNDNIKKIVFKEEYDKQIELNTEVAILSDCTDDSLLAAMCRNSNIAINKLTYTNLLEQLRQIDKKYILFVRKDAVITDTFDNVEDKIIIAGVSFPFAGVFPIENHTELLISGENKYINPYLIFGPKELLIKFFEDYFLYLSNTLHVQLDTMTRDDLDLYKLWFATSKLSDKYQLDSQGDIFNTITDTSGILIEQFDQNNTLNKYVDSSQNQGIDLFRLF